MATFINNQVGLGGGPVGTWTAYQQAAQLVGPSYGVFPSPTFPRPIIPREQMRVGEIIAWRGWLMGLSADDPWLLHSVAVGTPWLPDNPMKGDVGEDGWNLGVHAFKTRELLRHEYGGFVQMVVGTVELYGEVVECERGYRASHGKIKTVEEIQHWDRSMELAVLTKIRKKYGLEP